MLRLCFNYDRKLLGELSRCFYDSIKDFLAAAAQGESFAPDLAALPALISSVQTYGDDPMRFHPHLHCLAADGLLGPEGSFFPLPRPARLSYVARRSRRSDRSMDRKHATYSANTVIFVSKGIKHE